jgi:hypothetical protein
MRPITILCITLLLACAVQVGSSYHQATEVEQLRLSALQGSRSAMQALRDTSTFILPWERCAWALILAELDTGEPVAMSNVPVCRQMIRPEGESLMLEYTAQLKAKIVLK